MILNSIYEGGATFEKPQNTIAIILVRIKVG